MGQFLIIFHRNYNIESIIVLLCVHNMRKSLVIDYTVVMVPMNYSLQYIVATFISADSSMHCKINSTVHVVMMGNIATIASLWAPPSV